MTDPVMSIRTGTAAPACLLSALLLPAAIHLWGPLVTVYGHWRIATIEREMREGPYIALIQSDVVALPGESSSYDENLLLENLQNLSEIAVNSAQRPSVVVWPEGVFKETIPNQALLEAPFDPRMTEFLIQPGEQVPDESILRERWEGIRSGATARTLAFREWVRFARHSGDRWDGSLDPGAARETDAWIASECGFTV